MCQAHVLRFRCGHGLVMSIEACRLAPCCILKTTSGTAALKLQQQPSKCYNCEFRRASLRRPASSGSPLANATSASLSATATAAILEPPSPTSSSPKRTSLMRAATSPLPNVVCQPEGTVLRYCATNANGPPLGPTKNHNSKQQQQQQQQKQKRMSSSRSFSFSCSLSCSHNATPHYSMLPSHLPHQDHPCPPCQIEQLKAQGDREAVSSARSQFPHLTSDMLVRNGRVRENWQAELTLDKFIDERRMEEKQMWCFVVRKWTQDLKKSRVLVNEEDGLGLV